MRRARLLIVDDHDLAREGLRLLLSGAPDLEIVGEASTVGLALRMCRDVRPDLVLMDVRLPDMDGLEATRRIRQDFPSIRVLLFTMYEAADYIAEAGRSGAVGYSLKGASRSEILSAVRQALRQPHGN